MRVIQDQWPVPGSVCQISGHAGDTSRCQNPFFGKSRDERFTASIPSVDRRRTFDCYAEPTSSQFPSGSRKRTCPRWFRSEILMPSARSARRADAGSKFRTATVKLSNPGAEPADTNAPQQILRRRRLRPRLCRRKAGFRYEFSEACGNLASDVVVCFCGSARRSHCCRPAPHRLDEFPAGYSLDGCSPAGPPSASPTGLSIGENQSVGNVLPANGNPCHFLLSHAWGAVPSF
jgi:hypothetical protein